MCPGKLSWRHYGNLFHCLIIRQWLLPCLSYLWKVIYVISTLTRTFSNLATLPCHFTWCYPIKSSALTYLWHKILRPPFLPMSPLQTSFSVQIGTPRFVCGNYLSFILSHYFRSFDKKWRAASLAAHGDQRPPAWIWAFHVVDTIKPPTSPAGCRGRNVLFSWVDSRNLPFHFLERVEFTR